MTTGYIYLFITLYAVFLGEKYLYRFVIINYENCAGYRILVAISRPRLTLQPVSYMVCMDWI